MNLSIYYSGLLRFVYPFIEYFLWLRPMGRTVFVLDICRSEVILFRFIMFPLFKLLKFQKGINYDQASNYRETLRMLMTA
jgi:hypothetical protein